MQSETSLRVFVAIEIPARELARIGQLVDGLRRHRAHIAWVPAANVHVTLAFLGNIEFDRVGSVATATTVACDRVTPFELALAGTGCFPSRSRPKVLWTGVRGDLDALSALQRGVTTELAAAGFRLDEKPFRPHLTIGRVKESRSPEVSSTVDDLERSIIEGVPFAVNSVTVLRSELLPSGARYTALARVGLAGLK